MDLLEAIRMRHSVRRYIEKPLTDDIVEKETRYFRHFKGNYYRLLHIAYDSETQERMCVYQALYGEGKIWVRPEAMFFEEIERNGKHLRRFQEVTLEELPQETKDSFLQ